jgi:hypothetical protein
LTQQFQDEAHKKLDEMNAGGTIQPYFENHFKE